MEEQFEGGGYQVVMLQETKGQGGQCQTQRYYRLATEPQRHWGVAIWLSRTLGMINLDGYPVMPGGGQYTGSVLHTKTSGGGCTTGSEETGNPFRTLPPCGEKAREKCLP